MAPVEACRSDPARSTSDILDTFSPVMLVIASCRFCVSYPENQLRRVIILGCQLTMTVKTAWDLEDVSFILVDATVLACNPVSLAEEEETPS